MLRIPITDDNKQTMIDVLINSYANRYCKENKCSSCVAMKRLFPTAETIAQNNLSEELLTEKGNINCPALMHNILELKI